MEEFARIKRLPPYVFNITGELKAAARKRGEDVIDLSMGNPDGPTPKHIVDKLIESVQRPDTHGYSVSKGIPRLRRAICNWYKTRFNAEFDPDSEAIVTIGSKEGIAHLALATLDRGDIVLVPNPSYPIHIYGPVIAGADIRHVPMIAGVNFFDELERAIRDSYPKPKMLICNFPGNPTTQCVDLSFFERLIAIAREHQIYVVHDLAYADIVFDGYRAPSIMEVPGARDVAVEFFTLSKSYNMAGWRVGCMVGNRDLVTALARMKSYHDYGHADPGRVDHRARRPAGMRRGSAHEVPEAARRDVRGAARRGVERRDSQSHDVRVGENPRAIQGDALPRVFEKTAGGSACRGVARHRLWRVR